MTKLASGLNNQNIINLNNHGTGKIANNGNIANNKNYLILDYYSKRDLIKYIKQGGFTEIQAKLFLKKIFARYSSFTWSWSLS